jgi:hypothetical protein
VEEELIHEPAPAEQDQLIALLRRLVLATEKV